MATTPGSAGAPSSPSLEETTAQHGQRRGRERWPGGTGTRDGPRVAYRCVACGQRFTVTAVGVAPCPRCQSVDDHEALGPRDGDGENG